MSEPVDRKYPHPDFTLLKEMAEGDEAFFKEIIALFLENGPALVTSIEESAAVGDCEALRFAAHKILSDLSIVGIKSAIKDVEIIEKQAALKNIAAVNVERAIEIINYGIEDLKKLV
jgi:HPt (histidine-containing phosphotransfer) domain-containing protein